MKCRSCWLIFTLRSKFGSHRLIIWKYDTHASDSLMDIRQKHWTMKYRPHIPTFILKSYVRSYWPIIQSMMFIHQIVFQHVTQNCWTMKYRSQWPILYPLQTVFVREYTVFTLSICPSIFPWRFGFSLIFSTSNDWMSSNLANTLISSRQTFLIEK